MSALPRRPRRGSRRPRSTPFRTATPFLALDLAAVERAHAAMRRALPHVALHYAVKCNPEPALLARLHALGAGFEVASLAELESLVALGIDARDVLYSNPVKPARPHHGRVRARGRALRGDSRCELEKLAAHAPGARVYVRLDAADATSRVPLAGKFGVDPATALALLARGTARSVFVRTASRSTSARRRSTRAPTRARSSWPARCCEPRTRTRLRLELLDIGGGLPARYCRPDPAARGVRARDRNGARAAAIPARASWPSRAARSSPRPACSRRR